MTLAPAAVTPHDSMLAMPSPRPDTVRLDADVVTLTAALVDIESVSRDEARIADAVERYQKRTGNQVMAHVQGISASGGVYAMAGADHSCQATSAPSGDHAGSSAKSASAESRTGHRPPARTSTTATSRVSTT